LLGWLGMVRLPLTTPSSLACPSMVYIAGRVVSGLIDTCPVNYTHD